MAERLLFSSRVSGVLLLAMKISQLQSSLSILKASFALLLLCLCSLLFGGCKQEDDSGESSSGTSRNGASGQSEADGQSSSGNQETIPDLDTILSGSGDAGGQALDEVSFVDVASSSGIEFIFDNDQVPNRYWMPEIMGGGVGWLDFDLDSRYEPVFANGSALIDSGVVSPAGEEVGEDVVEPPAENRPRVIPGPRVNRMFHQRGEDSFADVTGLAGCADAGFGQGVAVGDFNLDGFPDLFFSNYGQDRLYINLGDGTYEPFEVPEIEERRSWSTSSVWTDVNFDGLPDLFVVQYVDWRIDRHVQCYYSNVPGYCGPGRFESTRDLLFINLGDGRFEERGESSGFNTEGKGLVVAAVDVNEDLKPELYVGTDLTANSLYTADNASETGSYVDVAPVSGVDINIEGAPEASMGIACWDFDRDEAIDIYLTHYFKQKNTLYRNLGVHREQDAIAFEDDSFRSRAAATSFLFIGFGVCVLDYDLNGDGDLFVTNGHVLGELHNYYELTPQLLRNRGSAVFQDVSKNVGEFFESELVGRGVGSCDFDNDGDTDIAVTHLHTPIALLRNDGKHDNRFIGLHLIDASRRPLAGGRVVVETESLKQTIPLVGGGSYLSSNDPRLQIGIADADSADVTIYWNDGHVDHWPNLSADRYWTFIQDHRFEMSE